VSRNEIRDANRDAMSAGWRLAIWIIAVVVFFGALGVGIWYFKVHTSDVKGEGDQKRQNNSNVNRTNAQQWFEAQYGKIRETDRNIDQAAAERKAKPDDEILRANYLGLQNSCVRMVEEYNAKSTQVLYEDWKSPGLPDRIDGTDNITDCKESTK